MPDPHRPVSLLAPAVLAMVAALCATYMVSQFLRNSLTVIAPDLARDLALSPAELGTLSSVFFLTFAAAQVPLGIAMDRWGPRRAILLSIGLAILGCLLFAAAESFPMLGAARVLMGLGAASFFMAPLAIYARWFPPERFARLAGIQQGFGTLGNLAATAPLALAVAAIGWRWSFVAVAAFTTVCALAVLILVRDDPPTRHEQARAGESWAEAFAGVIAATRVPHFWPVAAIHLGGYSTFAATIGLWIGPYLRDVYGLGLIERGNILLVAVGANVAGLIGWGAAHPALGSYRRLVLCGALASVALLFLLAAHPMLPMAALIAWLALFGLAIGYQPLYIAHGRSLFPDRLVGRGITLLNMGTMGGGFLLQFVTGFAIDAFAADANGERGPAAYAATFGLTAVWLTVFTAIYGVGTRPLRER